MENKSESSDSNFTLALGSSGKQPEEEEVSSFSKRLDAIFGGLENNISKPSLNDSLAKPVNPNLSVDSRDPKKNRKACFSCGSTSHLSRACPHAPRGSGSANNPTSQSVPSHLRDSSKYTHYTIDRDYDANEEKASALNFIAQLQRTKEDDVVEQTEGFTPVFAPKNERSSKKTNPKNIFSTNVQSVQETKDQKEEKETGTTRKTKPVSLSHLEDEDGADDIKTDSGNMITKDDLSTSTTFKKKKRGKQRFRKHTHPEDEKQMNTEGTS